MGEGYVVKKPTLKLFESDTPSLPRKKAQPHNWGGSGVSGPEVARGVNPLTLYAKVCRPLPLCEGSPIYAPCLSQLRPFTVSICHYASFGLSPTCDIELLRPSHHHVYVAYSKKWLSRVTNSFPSFISSVRRELVKKGGSGGREK